MLRHCVIRAEQVGGLAEALEDRDAAEDIVRWINTEWSTEDYTEEPNHDSLVAIRIFGKRTLKRDEVPESLAWVPTGTSNNHDPTPRRSEMLDWDAAKKMADEGTNNPRDAALKIGRAHV